MLEVNLQHLWATWPLIILEGCVRNCSLHTLIFIGIKKSYSEGCIQRVQTEFSFLQFSSIFLNIDNLKVWELQLPEFPSQQTGMGMLGVAVHTLFQVAKIEKRWLR